MRSLVILVLLVAILKPDPASNAVKHINYFRTIFKVPLLIESEELKKGATDYAKYLATLNIKKQKLHEDILERFPTIDHMAYPRSDSANTNYTENICEFRYPDTSYAILFWTRKGAECYQVGDFHRTEVQQSLSDKFTALYWRNSTEVGVGLASKRKRKGKRAIMVVRFSPPGNQPGQYKDNVFLGPNENIDDYLKPPKSSYGDRQQPVSWIYFVLFVQNYLFINWLT